MIVFERGTLVFVFNLHWNNSYTDYRVGCLKPGKYKVETPLLPLDGLVISLKFFYFNIISYVWMTHGRKLRIYKIGEYDN